MTPLRGFGFIMVLFYYNSSIPSGLNIFDKDLNFFPFKKEI